MKQRCIKAKVIVDAHGEVLASHLPDKCFDLPEFLLYLNKHQGITWKEIFWMVWMQLQVFTCLECKLDFCGTDLENCTYHDQGLEPLPQDLKGSTVRHLYGKYQCCGKVELLFSTSVRSQGCKHKQHQVFKQDKADILNQSPYENTTEEAES